METETLTWTWTAAHIRRTQRSPVQWCRSSIVNWTEATSATLNFALHSHADVCSMLDFLGNRRGSECSRWCEPLVWHICRQLTRYSMGHWADWLPDSAPCQSPPSQERPPLEGRARSQMESMSAFSTVSQQCKAAVRKRIETISLFAAHTLTLTHTHLQSHADSQEVGTLVRDSCSCAFLSAQVQLPSFPRKL